MNNTRQQVETRLSILFELLITNEISLEKYTTAIENLTENYQIKSLF